VFRDVASHASEAIGATSNAAAAHVTADLQALSHEINRLSQSLGNTSLIRQLENLSEATGRVSMSIDGTAGRMKDVTEETAAFASRVRDAKSTFDLSSIQRALDQIAEGFASLDEKLAQSLSRNSLPARLDQLAAAADQMTATVGRTSDALNPVVSNLVLFQDKIAALPTAVDTNKLRARFEALCDVLADQENRLKVHASPDASAANQSPSSSNSMHMNGPKVHDVEKENEDPQAILQ
jgi:ABC-type transporter Mla subunit MlaD